MAPGIKTRLESEQFTNGPIRRTSRLAECLASDPRHITPGKRDPSTPDGMAVTAIQDALRKIRSELMPKLPEIKDAAGDYGRDTVAAVLAYKGEHRIQRQGQRLDNIVGRMTITQLDDDLLKIEGKKNTIDADPTQDVYIKIFGFNDPSQQAKDISTREDAQAFINATGTPDYLKKHHPLQTIWFVGGVNPTPVPSIVTRAIAAVAGKAHRIMISGGSSGGRNALEVAEKLHGAKLNITFIGLWDAAFQKEHLVDQTQFNRNENFNPEKPATLLFKGTQAGGEKLNFFQSWGHCLDRQQEIHGAVQGFVPTDLTRDAKILAIKKAFDNRLLELGRTRQAALEAAHVAAFLHGQAKCEDRVKAQLAS